MTTPASSAIPINRAIHLIASCTVLETLRKRDLFVLLLLASIYAVGVVVARVVGIENPATATFLLNLGLYLAYLASHALVLLHAAAQLPQEMEQRTLYPLLAKPVERSAVILGKWVASCLVCVCAYLVLAGLAASAAPRMESTHAGMLAQTLVLHVASLGLLAALAVAGSLVLPKAVNVATLALLAMSGDKITGLASAWIGDRPAAPLFNWILGYLPEFTKLNVITRYTDGLTPLSAWVFGGLLGYATIFMAASLLFAIRLFERKPL